MSNDDNDMGSHPIEAILGDIEHYRRSCEMQVQRVDRFFKHRDMFRNAIHIQPLYNSHVQLQALEPRFEAVSNELSELSAELSRIFRRLMAPQNRLQNYAATLMARNVEHGAMEKKY